jgi:predicted negative regulator of RcsB-dependent stress response
MPKAIKKRISKKTTDTEAEVREKFSTLKDTLRERQQTAMKFGAGILVAIIAVASFFIYSNTTRKKAQEFEYQAYKIFYRTTQLQASETHEQYTKALELFNKSYETRKSPAALFYIAACNYELARYDDALKALKEFTQKYSGERRFIPLAYQKMATVYIKKGDMNEAVKTLDLLYALPGDTFKDLALLEAGKLLEKQGKVDEAKKKYEELTGKFPTSPYKSEAEAKLSGKKEG